MILVQACLGSHDRWTAGLPNSQTFLNISPELYTGLPNSQTFVNISPKYHTKAILKSGKNQETRFDVGSKQCVRYGVFNVMWNNLEKWKYRLKLWDRILTRTNWPRKVRYLIFD